MRFRLREGVVLEKVCGENILIATLKARNYCPNVTQINDAAADLWRLFSQDLDLDDIVKNITANYDISTDEAKEIVLAFAAEMENNGYLLKEDEDDQE